MTFSSIEDVDPGLRDEIDNITGSVRRQLNSKVRDFRVLLQDNGVILQGYAVTFYAKPLAQHAMMQAIRLPIVANDIEVEMSVPREVTGGYSW
jgi:hypothetical protein